MQPVNKPSADERNPIPSSRLKSTAFFLSQVLDDLLKTFLKHLSSRLSRTTTKAHRISIGFDGYPFVEPLTGIGRYAEHLLKNFAAREDITINLYTHALIPEREGTGLFISLDGMKNVKFRYHAIPANILMGDKIWFGFGAAVLTPLFIALDGNDVFFAPNFVTPKLFRVIGKRVITIHDCTFAYYPELLQRETLQHLSKRLPREVEIADRIIAVSTQTRRDIEKIFSVRSDKITVVLHGNPIASPLPYEPPNKPYLLVVGTLEPRKNITAILDAFEIVRRQGISLNLNIIGKVGWKSASIRKRLKQHPFAHAISHLSYAPSEQLGSYYAQAFCLVFPSLYEGFGFPVLEAMSLGCPVVATPLESIKEVGGDACLYVGQRPHEIAEGIIRLYENPQLREDLAEKGKVRARQFSWEKCAGQTLEVLTGVAQNRTIKETN